MKLTILPSARDDLANGFGFYEAQEEGLGSYFLESLFRTLTPLGCMPASTERSLVSTGRYPSAFLMRSTTPWNLRLR